MATSSKLDAKIPVGELEGKWTKFRSTVPLVNPANKRSIEIIVVGTLLPHRAVLMQPKIIKTMATLPIAFFMIPSKAATTVPERPTCIA
jgi:hypothetical protein